MPPQNMTVSNTQTAGPLRRDQVTLSGFSVFSQGLAVLEWGGDNHIRLYAIDPKTGQASKTVFDCLPSQIEQVKVRLSMLILKIAGKTYYIDFAGGGTGYMVGGVIGIAMQQQQGMANGLDWWLASIRQQGLEVKQLSSGKLITIGLLGGVGLVVLIIIGFVVVAAFQS